MPPRPPLRGGRTTSREKAVGSRVHGIQGVAGGIEGCVSSFRACVGCSSIPSCERIGGRSEIGVDSE